MLHVVGTGEIYICATLQSASLWSDKHILEVQLDFLFDTHGKSIDNTVA